MRRNAAVLLVAVLAASAAPGAEPQARLAARSVLPASAARRGSPPSGAFLSSAERAVAAANGVRGPAEGPYLPAQPVQGFSSMVPAAFGTWWALADNGFAWRTNSADFQLAFFRVDPRWDDPAGARVEETVVLRDPDRKVPWTIVCDPGKGAPLPAFSFNALPPPPAACGATPSDRVLTGFDFDPESFVLAPDGTFWVSEEFGPFLLHVSADGRLLEPPVPFPGVKSPQNPTLAIGDRARAERPDLAASRGPEGLAISPDGSRLWALLEGAVTGDDARDLRIYAFDPGRRAFEPGFLRVRLEMPSQAVDLSALLDATGARVYPGASAPVPGPVSIGELKAVNDRQLLMIERDNLGDGDFFRLPFYTIESVHVVDRTTLLVASDNNYPFSNGRARSRGADRKGPLAADATEMVLVRLGTPLDADPRLFPSGGK